MIDTRLVPQDFNGKDPLCMEQYYQLFSTYREPGLTIDRQTTSFNENHAQIVVAYKAQFFAMTVRTKKLGLMHSNPSHVADEQGRR